MGEKILSRELVRRIPFQKWMEQSGIVDEKILGRKIDIKNYRWKINLKK